MVLFSCFYVVLVLYLENKKERQNMKITIKQESTTRKVAVKVMLQGGYKLVGGESWSSLYKAR